MSREDLEIKVPESDLKFLKEHGFHLVDEDTAEMLDIISTTTYFAFVDVFYAELGGNSDILSNYVTAGSQGLASFFESRKSNIEQLLENLYEDYNK